MSCARCKKGGMFLDKCLACGLGYSAPQSQRLLRTAKRASVPRVSVAEPPAMRTPIPVESFRYVLKRVGSGASIRSACRELRQKGERAPSPQRFLAWCEKKAERWEQYQRAKRLGIELLTDEMHALLDSAGDGTTDPAMLNAQVNKARAQVWGRQWTASKLLPKVYGDKLQHEHTGNVSITVDTGVRRLAHETVQVTDAAYRVLDDDLGSELAQARAQAGRAMLEFE
jgi:hypothetical protein